MWVPLWLALSVTSICAQYFDTRLSQDGAEFGWGWQLTPVGTAGGSIAQYYVKLPQSEQQVLQYSPGHTKHQGDTGYTNNLLQTHSVALQQPSLELSNQKEDFYKIANTTQIQAQLPSAQPNDNYLKQQQYTPYIQTDQVLQIPTTTPTVSNFNSLSYNKQHEDHAPKIIENFKTEEFKEYISPVQIYKDHNCTEHNEDISDDLRNDLKKSQDLFAEVSSYDFHDINDFATTLPKAYNTYQDVVKLGFETDRPHARNEKFLYTTVETPNYAETTTLYGIDRLVASTQNLISNEDLLFINNAAEQAEERSRYNKNNDKNNEGQDSRNHITVTAKIENIVNDDDANQPVPELHPNNYNFAAPIVVSESSYKKLREQTIDNIVSTVIPYMENDYRIVGIKETIEENPTIREYEDNKVINVTPRTVNLKYLAPITVALRLINANNSELFNTVDDFEASDSEIISKKVKSPEEKKTVVEVQKSIPVDITHINDVEVHEYIDLDEERSNDNGPLDLVKTLYNKYVDALESSKKIQENMSKLLYKYGTARVESEGKTQENDSDHLQPSENVQSAIKVNINGDSYTQRSEHIQYYDDYQNENDNIKVTQPIIIENDPVVKYVDRFIEKNVPYAQHVEVRVPIDRPVPVEKTVEKPVEVTRYVDKPYPVVVPRPYPVEVKVPYPVEQKVYVDRPIHIPYPVEKVVEKQVIQPVAVPAPVAIPIEVPYPVEHKILYPVAVDRPVSVPVEVEKPVEKIVHKEVQVPYAVEKKVPYPVPYETRVPVPYPVEKPIPFPVERIVEKPVTLTQFIEKPVHIQVPVPQPVAVPIHVPQLYPIERIVEKNVPYPVAVDRIVEKPVQVPYPVEKIVEKIVEKPVVVTKYVDRPYPVEVPYPVEKTAGKPAQLPYRNAYSYSEINYDTRYNPQYQNQNYENDKQKKGNQQNLYVLQHYELLKEKEKLKLPIQSTHWGNHYASSYQYINNTSGNNLRDAKKFNLSNYVAYLSNAQSKSNQYYGPVPMEDQDDWWQTNKNYIIEVQMNKSDREPKINKFRIEYGGFKPPLIPSTEVDLEGKPIKKET